VRKLLLIAAAALASIAASVWGFFDWWRASAAAQVSVLFAVVCLLTALSFPAFVAWLRWPRLGVTLAWLLLSGSWFAAFLIRLRVCQHQACSTVDSLRIAAETITGERHLWPLLITAVCLLFAWTQSLTRTPPAFNTAIDNPPDE
jgi:hypothetical protein